MDFVIDKQKKEAERMRIEAEGIKVANDILAQSITEKILEYNRIKMYEGLMKSGNSKVIITDGKAPLFNTLNAGDTK